MADSKTSPKSHEAWYRRLDLSAVAAALAILLVWPGWRWVYKLALGVQPKFSLDEPLIITIIIVPALVLLHMFLPSSVRRTLGLPLLATIAIVLFGGSLAAIGVGQLGRAHGWQDAQGKAIWAAVAGAILSIDGLLIANHWWKSYAERERKAGRSPWRWMHEAIELVAAGIGLLFIAIVIAFASSPQ